jgi:hypothetical protein
MHCLQFGELLLQSRTFTSLCVELFLEGDDTSATDMTAVAD